MFVTDKFVYIQMQKTGCSHIALLLSSLFEGEQIGKHDPATPEQISRKLRFISSIRNPWDWYLSLWTYGVQGQGGLHDRLTHKHYRKGLRSFHRAPLDKLIFLMDEVRKDTQPWAEVYQDGQDVALFRRWLQMVHTPDNAVWLGEGYDSSGLSGVCGFMTYRYLYLCCQTRQNVALTRNIKNIAALEEYDRTHCYIDSFIHQETLEDHLCTILQDLGSLEESERDLIYSMQKTNTSRRPLKITDYYDQASIELVRERDALLIHKFSYQAPDIQN